MISLFFQETFPIKLHFCGYKPSIKILKLNLEKKTFCKRNAIVNRGFGKLSLFTVCSSVFGVLQSSKKLISSLNDIFRNNWNLLTALKI